MAEAVDQVDGDYQHVFGSEEGERVLRDLMKGACIWGESSYDPNPYATAYNEGRRSIILQILEHMRRKWTPQEFADELTQAQRDYASTRPATDPSHQTPAL